MGSPLADRLDEAFRTTPRRDFLPPAQRGFAGSDQPLDIGYAATCSQPTAVRLMLEQLDVRPGQRVLDVGSGSGWTTALLAALVGPEGEVVGVEREPALVERGRAAVRATGRSWARVEQAEAGVLGWPDEAPYDRVLVSAEPGDLPGELVDQLAPGGVMVTPVSGRMTTVTRDEAGAVTSRSSWHCRFVPLVR